MFNGWIKKGYTVEEAISRICEIQRKAHSQVRKLRRFEKSLIPILDHLKLEYELNKMITLDDRYKGTNKYYLNLDYYIPKYNLNIEMDGDYWHKDALEEDKHRDTFLTLLGYKIFRIKEKKWIDFSNEEKITFIGRKICELNQ